MSDLTGDLVEEILCRVPATSLKRLRSTCKRWDRLFDDKRFTSKHFDKAPKQSFVLTLNKFRIRPMSFSLSSVVITGELSLNDLLPNLYHCEIERVFHYDGLLLCTNGFNAKIMVWNPCTGKTRRIEPRGRSKAEKRYALGSYKDNKSGIYSYKVLCYDGSNHEFEIYDMNSNSWRVLDVAPDCRLAYVTDSIVSLKGKTYWFARDKKVKEGVMSLISFDYTTERFERLHLWCLCPMDSYKNEALSVVREEKLSVLVERDNTSKTEIWVTNKIYDERTKVVSWSMILSVNLKPELLDSWHTVSFVVDEEKKVLVCCERYTRNDKSMHVVYIVGEDNNVREVDVPFSVITATFLFNYAPSLTEIQQGVGCKRKSGE